jgi:hypothetical protein
MSMAHLYANLETIQGLSSEIFDEETGFEQVGAF